MSIGVVLFISFIVAVVFYGLVNPFTKRGKADAGQAAPLLHQAPDR
jgi:hypothetical protein